MTRSFRIKVRAGARIEAVEEAKDSEFQYRVYVRAAPENGRANQAVIALLATHFSVPKSTIAIVKGEHSPQKTIEIQ